MNLNLLIAGVCFIVAIAIAFILCKPKKPDGRILINYSDPMKDVYILELNIPFGELDRRKTVIFEVEKI